MVSDAVIEVSELTRRFGARTALASVSRAANQNQRVQFSSNRVANSEVVYPFFEPSNDNEPSSQTRFHGSLLGSTRIAGRTRRCSSITCSTFSTRDIARR